ncbi:MAG: hypothetical protein ABSF18_06315, partial [Gammaproteobacteria bacterium]
MNINLIPVILASLILAACGSDKPEQNPPHPLTNYAEQVSYQESGSVDVGSGDGDTYLHFQPALMNKDDDVYIYATDYKGRVTA